MEVEIVNVSPTLAAQWLTTSAGNPRWAQSLGKPLKLVNAQKVARFARDMENGMWYPGTGAIGFSEEGVLLEGHHRLSAIIKAGVTVPMTVIRGISKEGSIHIDDNSPRTERQRTGISHRVLGVANVHAAILKGVKNTNSTGLLTTEEKMKFLELHPATYSVARITSAGSSKTNLLDFACAAHAFLCAYEYGVSDSKLAAFAESVRSGFIDEESETAAICVRNQLLQLKGNNTAKKNILTDFAIQMAIFDYCNGNPRRRSYAPKTGKYFDMNIATGNPLYTSIFGDS